MLDQVSAPFHTLTGRGRSLSLPHFFLTTYMTCVTSYNTIAINFSLYSRVRPVLAFSLRNPPRHGSNNKPSNQPMKLKLKNLDNLMVDNTDIRNLRVTVTSISLKTSIHPFWHTIYPNITYSLKDRRPFLTCRFPWPTGTPRPRFFVMSSIS